MTMPQNKEPFQWDDHLVKEYLRLVTSVEGDAYWQSELDKFKHSKQPKPKDWRILSFKRIKGNQAQTFDFKESTGYYVDSLTGYEIHTEEEMLHRGCCVDSGFFAIQSVQRLSDGDVFTIGEFVHLLFIAGGTPSFAVVIKEFTLSKFNEILVNGGSEERGHKFTSYRLHMLQKAKPTLFTTHDNVAIKAGDNYWYVIAIAFSLYHIYQRTAHPSDSRPHRNKTFATEENAKEYVLWNKPALCLEDVNQLCGDDPFINCRDLIGKLQALVKSKL